MYPSISDVMANAGHCMPMQYLHIYTYLHYVNDQYPILSFTVTNGAPTGDTFDDGASFEVDSLERRHKVSRRHREIWKMARREGR